MSQYFGDFSEDQTLYIPFNTFDSNDPSASVTITNLADADIKVHKDGSATQIVTDGATIAIDFDSITGNHLITVDTSAHADYSTGSDYLVRIEGTTVDGATINAWVGSFSIENRHSAGALRPTTAGRTLDVTAGGAAGIDWGNVENKTTANDLSGTDIQLVDTASTVTGGATSSALATVDSNVDAILLDTAEIGTAGAGLTDLGGMSTGMKAEVNTEADTALTDYDPPTDTEMVAAFTEIKGATWATTDSLEAIRDRGDAAWTTGAGGNDRLLMVDTTIATLASQTSFTLTAGSTDNDAYNNLSIVVEDVSTSTQKAVGMVIDYVGSTKTVTLKEALAFTIATTDKIYILAENSLKSTVANRQLDVTATGGSGIDWANVENPTTALDLSGTDIQLVDTASTVTGGATSAALATVDSNVDAILVDTADMQPKIGSPAADISADIAAVKVDTAATLVDTNELQTDWANGGRLDLILDARAAEATVAALQDISAANVNTEVVDVLFTDTHAELSAIPAANAPLADKINYIYMNIRNKMTQTATTATLFADDTSTSVGTSTVSDDATTATKGEWS
ncbi:MAG: hypothetical protein JKY53_00250 [Flavobacteriales bacterium]|nr:hypothetical protein [Flavobacteriales bacterium]